MYALASFGFRFRRSNVSKNDKNILCIRQNHVLVEFLQTNRQLRSSNDYLRLVYLITRVLAGDRTFTVAASKEWNKLPVYIRQSSSTNIFKKALKLICFLNIVS